MKTYVVGSQWKHLIEKLLILMSSPQEMFPRKDKKYFTIFELQNNYLKLLIVNWHKLCSVSVKEASIKIHDTLEHFLNK